MSLAIGDLMTISRNLRFLERVGYKLISAAISVMNEDVGTAHHVERVQYARSIIAGGMQSGLFTNVAVMVLTNPAIAAEADTNTQPDLAIPDSDIEFQVNSLFNSLAGISN